MLDQDQQQGPDGSILTQCYSAVQCSAVQLQVQVQVQVQPPGGRCIYHFHPHAAVYIQ